MAKNAVYSFSWHDLEHEIPFKKLALFFKGIYVNNLEDTLKIGHGVSFPHYPEKEVVFKRNLTTLEYLIDKKLVIGYKDNYKFNLNETTLKLNEERKKVNQRIDELSQPGFVEVGELFGTAIAHRKLFDIHMRKCAIGLEIEFKEEFYPVLKTSNSILNEDRKKEVIQLILNEIPEPDESTSWEQILEFKSDADVTNKYLALINWVNDISKSNFSINEIKEKYEYLYSDYIKHFKLHNMKYRTGVLEIIATAGLAVISGEPYSGIKLASDFLKLKVKNATLLEEEAKLPGKEIAYIYKANQKF